LKEKMIALCKRFSAVLFFVSLGLTVAIESLSRHDLFGGFKYLFEHPVLFVYNALFIFVTLHVSLLFKRRTLAAAFIAFVWLVFGIVNCIVLFFRTTPFSAVDFRLLDNAIDVVTLYLELWQLILIIAAIAAALAGVLYYFSKSKKGMYPVRYLRAGVIVSVLFAAIISSRTIAINADILPDTYPNIADAFENYGFAYCFSSSVLDVGIEKPKEYSEDYMAALLDELNFEDEASAERTPNIILVQLESLVDPYNFKNLTCSKDPLPNLHYLYENYSHGALTVPSIGAGTANTEYEVLAGVPLKFFGTGEYPYKTILDKSTAESLAYDLKALGYGTHAIHNNTASFYSRNKVFAHLGFDTYTSSEFMSDIRYNVLEWAYDDILTRYIMEALDSTKGQSDFVFTISVQSHGKYPTDYEGDMPITISGDLAAGDMQFYINQISDVDAWIGELLSAVDKLSEETVVIFYGDHYPTLGLEQDDLYDHTLYETQYVIWDNFGMEKQVKDLYTYQLGAYVFDRVGITSGYITQYHNSQMGKETYDKHLEMLAYDMMYGKMVTLGGSNPFAATDMAYGCTDIIVSSYHVNEKQGLLVVKGDHFTANAHIVLGDKIFDCTYENEQTLTLPLDEINANWNSDTKVGVVICNSKNDPMMESVYAK